MFAATFSRYCWEKEVTKHNKNLNYRVVSGMQIKNVEKIPNQIAFVGRDSPEKGIDILKEAESSFCSSYK